jgi:hypothetical protein
MQRHRSGKGYNNVTLNVLRLLCRCDKLSVPWFGLHKSTRTAAQQTYENSTLVYSNSFLLTRAHHKREHTSHRRGRNGVRRDKTIRPVLGEIGQQRRDQ